MTSKPSLYDVPATFPGELATLLSKSKKRIPSRWDSVGLNSKQSTKLASHAPGSITGGTSLAVETINHERISEELRLTIELNKRNEKATQPGQQLHRFAQSNGAVVSIQRFLAKNEVGGRAGSNLIARAKVNDRLKLRPQTTALVQPSRLVPASHNASTSKVKSSELFWTPVENRHKNKT
jgi:hypothetical protein